MRREQVIASMRTHAKRFDLIIIGGGATGIGAALEASARGYSVALLEQADFANGTSSRSTKLVHGGLRYLKQGNIRLVKEAMREREILAQNAPHLFKEQPFLIPNRSYWQQIFYGIGLKLYDFLATDSSLSASVFLNRKKTIQLMPKLNATGLCGANYYTDGQFDDARLALNLVQTAAQLGACIVNYCACTGFIQEQGRIVGVQVCDRENLCEFELRGRSIINAGGVFADTIAAMDQRQHAPQIALSQGVHLVLPRRFLESDAALMIPSTQDGRVLFAVPWEGVVIAGTTDTPVQQPALEPRALKAECDFILDELKPYLQVPPLAADVLSVYAGLRPLVRSGKEQRTADLSRDHLIRTNSLGLITIMGGKWTTYRRMAEDLLDYVELALGWTHRPSRSRHLPIHGAGELAATVLPQLQRYGTDAVNIMQLGVQHSAWMQPIHPGFDYLQVEVIWQARYEMARTVADVLARRTRFLLLNAQASLEAAPVVATLLAKELGKSATWKSEQVAQYQKLAEGYNYPESN
jgi:glycerol-3-phosphate dehydrogenase